MASVCSLSIFEMDELFSGSPSPSHWLRSGGRSGKHLISDSTDADAETQRETKGFETRNVFTSADRTSTCPLPLGTSAPIDIKWVSSGQRRRALQAAQKVSSSFVPPHLFTAEFTSQYLLDQGVSPTASLKKERLKVRDAVLRKTGYQ